MTAGHKMNFPYEQRAFFSDEFRKLLENNNGKVIPELLNSWTPYAKARIEAKRAKDLKEVSLNPCRVT